MPRGWQAPVRREESREGLRGFRDVFRRRRESEGREVGCAMCLHVSGKQPCPDLRVHFSVRMGVEDLGKNVW